MESSVVAYNNINVFKSRDQAGKSLGRLLLNFKAQDPIVLALPRGGVVVGYEVAKILNASFNVIISRKIGAPNNPEFGIGAVSEGNTVVLDKTTIKVLNLSEKDLDQIIEQEKEEIRRRIQLFRANRPIMPIYKKTVILVDDGLATGVTAKAAIESIKKLKPKQIIFAAPVCAYQSSKVIAEQVNSVVCEMTPRDLTEIGSYYRNFLQVSDNEVVEILKKAKENRKGWLQHRQ